ncbi:MAG TPA: cell envelope integrity protein CreD [Gallionellaceae bacterium]
MNRFPLLSKTMMAGLMAILLLIPLHLIESKIAERQGLQHSVQQDIARSSAGPQTIGGPYLVIKYRVRTHKTVKDKDGNEKVYTSESATMEQVIPPRNLKIDGQTSVETRKRGIYEAQVFNLDSTITGDFAIPAGYGVNNSVNNIIPESAWFVMGVSDSRGILSAAPLTLNGNNLEFAPGSISPVSGNGIHVQLNVPEIGQTHEYHFSFPFSLQGMSTLSVIPAGNNTEMTLKSPWPHPSFGGDYLPRSRTVDASGFSAEWTVSNLAHNTASGADAVIPGKQETFSVSFIDPVNIYLMSERAIKYGVLFVVLVFTSFFMFEILRGLRIHPLQYLLVGLAMAMFFLLIISLSEHIPFLPAYAISGAACSVLIGAYLAGVLKNRKLATGFAGGIALLYAVLFGVLKSEDNALLMGTAILFTALAAVMLLTRHMDWYRLGSTPITAAE